MKTRQSIATVLVLLALAGLFGGFLLAWTPRAETPPLARQYLTQGPGELRCANVVTSIVVAFRGLDTLGEVTVLFCAALAVGVVLRRRPGEAARPAGAEPAPSPLVRAALPLLVPMIVLLGVYIMANGHLSPGGGFQGGAVLASAFLAIYLAGLAAPAGDSALKLLESGSGFLYLLTGLAGIALGAAFLDATILPLGRLGRLFSAGTIPVIYVLIGLKVGGELAALTAQFKGEDHG
jgi:multicomponent Na+:H+ antiporter subunit B